jgi:hypothetical protein
VKYSWYIFILVWDETTGEKVYFSNIFFLKNIFSKFSSPLWPTEVKRLIFASSHGRRKLRGFGLIFAGTSLANFCLKTSVGSPKSMKKTNFYRLWGNFCWLLLTEVLVFHVVFTPHIEWDGVQQRHQREFGWLRRRI